MPPLGLAFLQYFDDHLVGLDGLPIRFLVVGSFIHILPAFCLSSVLETEPPFSISQMTHLILLSLSYAIPKLGRETREVYAS